MDWDYNRCFVMKGRNGEFCVTLQGAPACIVTLHPDGSWDCECGSTFIPYAYTGQRQVECCQHIVEAFAYHRHKEGRKNKLRNELVKHMEIAKIKKSLDEPDLTQRPQRKINLED